MTLPTNRIAALKDILARVEGASGPNRELDVDVWALIEGYAIAKTASKWVVSIGQDDPDYPIAWVTGGVPWIDPNTTTDVPEFSSSIDAAVELAERMLPGWWFSIGTCCVSDDARMAPDFNSPIHGERLKREIGSFEAGSIWDAGIDIDRRPSGNLPLAFLAAIFRALIAIAENETARVEGREMSLKTKIAFRERRIRRMGREEARYLSGGDFRLAKRCEEIAQDDKRALAALIAIAEKDEARG